MAYSIVQDTNQAKGTSPKIATFSSTPTTGNLLLASCSISTASSQPVVSDSNGNWTLISPASGTTNGTQGLWLFGIIAVASAPTAITITSSGNTVRISLYEFSGNASSISSIVDNAQTKPITGASSVSSTTGIQPSVTTTNAADLIFTQLQTSGSITAPSITGGTLLQQNVSGSVSQVDGYQIETSTGTYTPYFSWTTAQKPIQITTAFLPSGGVATPTNQFFPFLK